MRKLILLSICFICILFFSLRSTPFAFSDELDDLTKQLNDLNTALSMSVNATRPLESQLIALQKQITDIKANVANIESDVATQKKEIDKGYTDLAAKTEVLNAKIKDYYIKSYYNSPLLVFLSSANAAELTQILAYQKAAENQDKLIITNIALAVTDLQQKKEILESEETRLLSLKTNLDEQSAKLDKVVSGAKAYQASLSSQIAQLSAKQQSLLAQKLGSLGLPTSAYTTSGGCSSDLTNGKDPGFSPRFGFFSFGVPHRVGMSQYGAKGRAEANQNAQQILQAYYNADLTSGYNTGANIHVTGTNEYGQSFDTTWNIEEYVKHIYEIPTNWPKEALKAQAIAARSYALAYTNNGASSICPSQQCQVVKQELNSQAWIEAVNDTSGQVLTSGGQAIKAWFSSTAGGYYHSSSDVGWSGTSYTKTGLDASGSVGSFSDLQNNAYDKSSPWFYCDWGGRSSYANTAWLKPEEVADIVNAVALAQAANQDSNVTKHLLQLDKSNSDGNWDESQVRKELQSRGGSPYTNVSSIGVNADFGSGKSTTVTVNGDGGTQSFPGDFFKAYFNLRAPASIQIVGPLYNVEKQ